jgi:CBS domain-containing protein
MQVKQILGEKGRMVVTLNGQATLTEAARLLAEKRVGAVVVEKAAGGLGGIISERDLVRALAEDGAAALQRPVNAYMTARVTTCTETDTAEALMEVMTRGRFRHVPVLDGAGKLCGVVSIGDVVKAHIAETAQEAASLRRYIHETG